MANGQPRPVFYVAVLIVVGGRVGRPHRRYGAVGTGPPAGPRWTEKMYQM
jgi:hypothetical protein